MARITITFPEELLHAVDETVKQLQCNRSQLVRRALSEFLDRIKQQEFEEALLADGYREMAQANTELVKESLPMQAAATESVWKWKVAHVSRLVLYRITSQTCVTKTCA